jgi:hypothetical protein
MSAKADLNTLLKQILNKAVITIILIISEIVNKFLKQIKRGRVMNDNDFLIYLAITGIGLIYLVFYLIHKINKKEIPPKIKLKLFQLIQ